MSSLVILTFRVCHFLLHQASCLHPSFPYDGWVIDLSSQCFTKSQRLGEKMVLLLRFGNVFMYCICFVKGDFWLIESFYIRGEKLSHVCLTVGNQRYLLYADGIKALNINSLLLIDSIFLTSLWHYTLFSLKLSLKLERGVIKMGKQGKGWETEKEGLFPSQCSEHLSSKESW